MKNFKSTKRIFFQNVILFSIILPIGCFTTDEKVAEGDSGVSIQPASLSAQPNNYYQNQGNYYYPQRSSGAVIANPGGEDEKVVNENGQYVNITASDYEHFKSPSTNKYEYFRVVMSSDGYHLRQIRGTDSFIRKQDPGGDQLIMQELSKFDKINYSDDGIVKVRLNGETGKVENVNFYQRVPRISELATLMRNDVTRWVFEHKEKGMPKVRNFMISYKVILKNRASIR